MQRQSRTEKPRGHRGHRRDDHGGGGRGSRSVDAYLYELLRKLDRRRVKYQRVLQRCQGLDRNQDGIIHATDLEDILVDYLGIDNVSRREIDRLARILRPKTASAPDGSIDYRELEEMFYQAEENMDETGFKQPQLPEDLYDPTNLGNYKRGSVGDLFEKNSCPAEKNNFRNFILCIEEFERMSGMKATMTDDGMVIPIGPELRAKINFYRA